VYFLKINLGQNIKDLINLEQKIMDSRTLGQFDNWDLKHWDNFGFKEHWDNFGFKEHWDKLKFTF